LLSVEKISKLLTVQDQRGQKYWAANDMNPNQSNMKRFWDLSLEILCLIDFENRFQDVSPAFESILGYTRDEVPGKLFTDFLHPDDLNATLAEAKLIPSGHIARNFENRYRRKDGSYVWLSWNAIPAIDEGLIYAIARDITRRKQAEEDLKQSEEKYRSLFESMSEAFVLGEVVLDEKGEPYDFRFLEVNQAWEKMTHISRNKAAGRTYRELFPRPIEDFIQKHARAALTGEPTSFELYSPYLNRWFSFYVHSPAKGKFASISTDITPRKQAEEALKRSEEKYRNLVESTSDFIWEVNQDGVYTYVSPKILDIVGYQPEEVLGKTPFDLMPPEEAGRVRQIFQRSLSQKTPFNSLENSNLHKDGHSVVLETSGVPFYDADGNLQGYRGVDRDITLRKKAEEEARKAQKEAEKRGQEAAAERQRLFNVLDTLPAIICLFTPDHHIKFANRAFREAYGEPGERFCYEYFGFSEPCKFCETHRVFKTGQPHHWEIKAPDGKILDAYDFPFIDTDGSSLVLELDIDITERRKAEKALAKAKAELELKVRERTAELAASEEKYRSVVDNASELIVVYQEGIKFINDMGLKMIGYSREELLSRPFIDFVHPDDRAMMVERSKRRATGETVSNNYEFRILHKDGSTRWLAVNAVLIQWQGKPATLGLMSDITIHKNMEDELKTYAQKITQVQEEERKRIAYELHDDTAQYLAILKLEIDSIIQSGKIKNSEILEKLKYLEKDAGRAVDDVRRYSHELRPGVLEHLGLVAALDQIIEDINKLKQLKVELTVEGEEGPLNEEVKLGFFRIAQEALNNCRKHSKALEASVILKFRENQLEMIVRDDGIGFDIQEARGRTGLRGSLGLMSMQERAKLIGANLKIESNPGKGTNISLEKDL
jgi:PAS domain S-box-containing protein